MSLYSAQFNLDGAAGGAVSVQNVFNYEDTDLSREIQQRRHDSDCLYHRLMMLLSDIVAVKSCNVVSLPL